MSSDAKTYHCPNCGGPLTFGIGSQAWDCKFCLSSFSLEQLEATEAAESTDDYLAGEGFADEGFGEGARAFSCASCGANIVTDDTTAATFCVFCRNPTIISARLKDQHRPQRIIPFKKSKEDAMRAFENFCKGKPLLPRAFLKRNHIDEMTGVYVPFWLFSAKADCAFDGEGDKVSTWSDSNYDYIKTDTYAVRRAGTMNFVGVPIDGSVKMSDQMMGAIEPFQYKELLPFSMQYLSGHFAEDYDFGVEKAKPVAKERMTSSARQAIRRTANYSSLRMHTEKTDFEGESDEYVMLPVWMLSTRYNDKVYTFAMNGQSGKLVGDLPISMGRFFAWTGGLTAVFFLLITVIAGWLL